MSYTKIKIGTVTIEPGTIRDRSYETASWYKRIELDPGEYEVFALLETLGSGAREDLKGKRQIAWIVYTIPGTVIEDNFPSSFGGFQFGSYDKSKNAGERETWSAQIYPHSIASAIVKGEEINIKLDPEWKAETHKFYKYGSDEKEILTTHKLTTTKKDLNILENRSL
jgi:hypothetical protein